MALIKNTMTTLQQDTTKLLQFYESITTEGLRDPVLMKHRTKLIEHLEDNLQDEDKDKLHLLLEIDRELTLREN